MMLGSVTDVFAQADDRIVKIAKSRVSQVVRAFGVITATIEQNEKHADYTPEKIARLDKQWVRERGWAEHPFIDRVLANETSKWLKEYKEKMRDSFSEVFVMDNKGMLVGTSDITSDYWQGDEAQWTETFLKGPKTFFVGEMAKDESSGVYAVKISMTLSDEEGNAIGAVTASLIIE
jgi:hypothetical protein